MIQKLKKSFVLLSVIFICMLFTNPEVVFSQVKSEKIFIGEKIKIHSEILNEDRTILIRFPKDYERSGKKYPVLYLLDAEFFFRLIMHAIFTRFSPAGPIQAVSTSFPSESQRTCWVA